MPADPRCTLLEKKNTSSVTQYNLSNQASKHSALTYSFNLVFSTHCYTLFSGLKVTKARGRGMCVCVCVLPVYTQTHTHTDTHTGMQWLGRRYLYKSIPMLGPKTTWGFSDNGFQTFLEDFILFPLPYTIRCNIQKCLKRCRHCENLLSQPCLLLITSLCWQF